MSNNAPDYKDNLFFMPKASFADVVKHCHYDEELANKTGCIEYNLDAAVTTLKYNKDGQFSFRKETSSEDFLIGKFKPEEAIHLINMFTFASK